MGVKKMKKREAMKENIKKLSQLWVKYAQISHTIAKLKIRIKRLKLKNKNFSNYVQEYGH